MALPQAALADLRQVNFPKQFTNTADLTPKELSDVLELAAYGKRTKWSEFRSALAHKAIGLLFFNPSLRTRISMEVGVQELGGHPVVLAPGKDAWSMEFTEGAVMNGDKTEHVVDAIRAMERHFAALCVRSFAEVQNWADDKTDRVMESFKRHARIPLISLESALWHPCQALADALTLKEAFGGMLGKKNFVLSWAPHPKQLPLAVPNSTLMIAAQLGLNVRLACPKDYVLPETVLTQVERVANQAGGRVELHDNQAQAFEGAHVIYAKSWTPPCYIGNPVGEAERRIDLQNWTIAEDQLKVSSAARVMHCQPVRRNVEIVDAVLDNSAICLTAEQAENRRHVQNALLISMLGDR